MIRLLGYQDSSGIVAGDRAPTALAGRLTTVAARLLPAEDRPRYLEEFRAELADIAVAGRSRRAELTYSIRQVLYAWHLRAELRAPHRTRAAR